MPGRARIAYLVNQYPARSHTFIRREIEALEAQGYSIARFSIRLAKEPLVAGDDHAELQRTEVVLAAGIPRLLAGALRVAASRPLRFARALVLALRIGWCSERGLARNLAYLAEACVLLGRFDRLGIGHVHAHFGTNPAAVALLCRVLGGPSYSFTVHGPTVFDNPQALRLDEKIRRAAFVIVNTSFARSQLYRWCPLADWPKVHVIRQGVSGVFAKQAFVPIADAPRLVCVGRLVEQKGHLILLQAAAQLAHAGILLELVLVGDGPLRPKIEALIGELGLQDQVQVAGWLGDAEVREQLLAARALVMPSFAEGLPTSIIEALALGRPVISTFVAGIPELVLPGVCGWLVPAGSVAELKDAMCEALEAPVEVLEQMGRRGAARVAERHDPAVETGKLGRLFDETVGPARM